MPRQKLDVLRDVIFGDCIEHAKLLQETEAAVPRGFQFRISVVREISTMTADGLHASPRFVVRIDTHGTFPGQSTMLDLREKIMKATGLRFDAIQFDFLPKPDSNEAE